MSNQALKYQLLAELLRSLEVEGFEFGTDKYLQLQDLLGKLPDVPIEELKHIFAPVICTNEKEQILFYTIFDQSLERVKAVHEPIKKIEVTEDESKKWWKWILLLSIPVAIGVIFLLFQTAEEIIEPLPKELNSIFFTVNPDSTRLLCLENLANKEDLEKFARFVRLGMGADSTAQKGETTWGKFEIQNTTCLKYSAKDSIGKDSIQVFLTDSLGRKTSIFFRANIEKPVIIEEPEQVTSPPVFKTKNHPFPNDIRSLEIQPLSDWENYIRNNAWWLKPLFMLLLAGLLWVIIKYLDARRRKLVAEIETQNKAPYVWNIDLEEVENIEMNDTFHSILNKLRQRTADEFALLDIPKTVESTIQKAGMADFKYRQLTRPPEYLLLIDQHSEANHRAHLFDFLYRAFKENEIHVERFFYNGDPQSVYNEAYPDGISLKDLQHRYYNARLLLLGSGYGLLSAMSGKLLKWTNIFNQWKQRSLLSPRPSEAWGRKESRLQETFHVLPASLQGIQFLIEELDAGEDADFSEWKTKVKDAPQEVIELEEQLIPSLRFYFPEKIVQWIAACAVYPSLHWDLTLHIGNLLSKPNESLLSIENLMEITRLPWFVEGKIPKEERAALLTYLENSHPDTLQRVRENLHELLKQNHPPADSVAYQDYRMNIALNEWLLTKDKKRKKELEKEIAKYLEAGIEADFTVIKYLDRERTPLDFIVPNTWKKYVHKAGHVGLGMKDVWKDIFYWALPIWLVLSILAYVYNPIKVCKGEEVLYQINATEEIHLCIKNPADRILYNEGLAKNAIQKSLWNVVDSLIFEVKKIGLNSNYVEPLNSIYFKDKQEINKVVTAFQKNVAVCYYNKSISNINLIDPFILLNQGMGFGRSGFELDITLYEDACLLISRALELDRNLDYIKIGGLIGCKISSNDTKVYVTVDRLNIRRAPSLKAQVIGNLRLFEGVVFLGELSDVSEKMKWRGKYVNEPWLRVQNTNGMIGWVYGAGVDFRKERIRGEILVDFGVIDTQSCINVGELFQFENRSKNANSYLWSFGDGVTSTDSMPTHTYEKTGEYIVKLTASNAIGSNFKITTITVCDSSNQSQGIILKSRVLDGSIIPPNPLQNVKIKGNNISTLTNNKGQYQIALLKEQVNIPITLSFFLDRYNTRTITITPSEFIRLDTIHLQPEYIDQDPIYTQQAEEIENLFTQILATLQKNQTGKCKDLAEKLIQELEDSYDDIELFPMEAAIANREQRNKEAVIQARQKTTEWIKEVQDCLDKNNPLSLPAMTSVKGGTFNMGCTPEQEADCRDSEKPIRENVQVNDFSIGTYEITNEEFAAFLTDNGEGNKVEGGVTWVKLDGKYEDVECGIEEKIPNQFSAKQGLEKHPMIYVSWYGAKAYCKWLSAKTGKRFRLPTETEWEYAARGGQRGKENNFKFSGSNTIDEVAWYSLNSDSKTHPVGQKKPNELGIYDLSGNVWEWIEDCWHKNYNNAPTNQQAWLEINDGNCTRRVVRGGSWSLDNYVCRVSYRDWSITNFRSYDDGFRVAQD